MEYTPWAQDPCIMFVNADSGLRKRTRNILEGEGFKVLTARNSVEALVLAADYPCSIDVLLTDGGMRVHQNGLELAECFAILRPETRVILATDPGTMAKDDLPVASACARMAKPLTAGKLVCAVARALELSPAAAAWSH